MLIFNADFSFSLDYQKRNLEEDTSHTCASFVLERKLPIHAHTHTRTHTLFGPAARLPYTPARLQNQ